ncbi:MAG TPA: ribonuclease P protein component [Verrucomicrobiae bacterium]|jgi:ribonuclease P protein component
MADEPTFSLRFPRVRRIKQGRDFLRAKTQGRRMVQGCLIANWLALPPGTPSRLGVITGRKLGNAVVRARARRLLREAFRLHQHDLAQPLDLVLVARPAIVGKKYASVEGDFMVALGRARLLKARPS